MYRNRLASVIVVLLAACDAPPGGEAGSAIGTREARAELFDTIVARTLRREAVSPIKNERLRLDLEAAMSRWRDAVVDAETEADLFYALARVSNARRDRHLEIRLVPGGIQLPDSAGVGVVDGPESDAPHAPIRVLPDYTFGSSDYFVSDLSRTPGQLPDPAPGAGDRIVSVNGVAMNERMQAMLPYVRSSTDAGERWQVAELLPMRTAALPGSFYQPTLELELERANGTRYPVSVEYFDPAGIEWADLAEPHYPGFSHVVSTPTWDLHAPDDGSPVLVLKWYGFRETLVEDVDSLVALASRRDWLDRSLIVDATRSRGGSGGAYAVQRLSPLPFQTTFGNLRLSDAAVTWMEGKKAEIAAGRALDSGVPESMDDGTWLLDWLQTDVATAIDAGADWTNNVPFKLAHAPRDSDGVLEPAPVGFRGRLVLLLGPRRGSHLDQFAAIVVDNLLGLAMGMPAGGYSNTWEWEEILTMPGTGRPVVTFMWSIGQTIRPNGEVLEGNPAQVDEYLPLTRDNFQTYYGTLIERSLVQLQLR